MCSLYLRTHTCICRIRHVDVTCMCVSEYMHVCVYMNTRATRASVMHGRVYLNTRMMYV